MPKAERCILFFITGSSSVYYFLLRAGKLGVPGRCNHLRRRGKTVSISIDEVQIYGTSMVGRTYYSSLNDLSLKDTSLRDKGRFPPSIKDGLDAIVRILFLS